MNVCDCVYVCVCECVCLYVCVRVCVCVFNSCEEVVVVNTKKCLYIEFLSNLIKLSSITLCLLSYPI